MQHMELQLELACRRLQVCRYGFAHGTGDRVDEQCNAGRRRHQLMQQLNPLRPYLRSQRRYAREIAARSSEAGDEAGCDGITRARRNDRGNAR